MKAQEGDKSTMMESLSSTALEEGTDGGLGDGVPLVLGDLLCQCGVSLEEALEGHEKF